LGPRAFYPFAIVITGWLRTGYMTRPVMPPKGSGKRVEGSAVTLVLATTNAYSNFIAGK